MTAEHKEEKRYSAYYLEWNPDEEKYEWTDTVNWEGEDVNFDTYSEFLDFMDSLTEEDKCSLGLWQLTDDRTGEVVTVNDGQFDTVNMLSLDAD